MRNQGDEPTQAAVIPVRRVNDGTVQVCLIRRKNSGKWGVPKGYIEDHDWEQAALTEANEEAGLNGGLIGDMVGTYEYQKGPRPLTVVVYVMEVLEERTDWREMRWRERRWYSIEEAGVLLEGHPVWALYDQMRQRLAAMPPDTPLRAATGFGEPR